MSILVTGGAGYIGSHVTRLLIERGESVVVVDNLTSGLVERIGDTPLVRLDLSDADAESALAKTMSDFGVTSVIHFAAQKQVGVSVAEPEFYYDQNVSGMRALLSAMKASGVSRLVFSSSAAAYGMPDVATVSEDVVCEPINPYGETKLIGEWMARNASKAWGLRAANLRYFNVAGAGWPELADTAVLNLVPIVFNAIAAGGKPTVFGTDYPTADGSCVRDYVHVLDLAKAHLSALDYLERDERPFDVFNVGTGSGSSVLEVLAEIRRVSGIDFGVELAGRRAGDPPALCADVSRINEVLGWRAEKGLAEIVESAWEAFSAKR
ncbi:MAG: UDP-glucose 4-epimerase GalE [Micrococcales bacterium]